MLASYGSFMRVTRFIAPVAEQKSRGPSSSSSSSLLQSTVYVKNAGEKAAFNDVTRVPWSCRKKQKEKKKGEEILTRDGMGKDEPVSRLFITLPAKYTWTNDGGGGKARRGSSSDILYPLWPSGAAAGGRVWSFVLLVRRVQFLPWKIVYAISRSGREESEGSWNERTNERVGIISFVFRFRISRVLIDTAYAPGVYNLLSIVVPLVVSTVPNSKR